MICVLIKKDMRLLRNYLWVAAVATLGCYLANGIGVYWLTTYQDESMQTIPVRTFLTLRGGSNLGLSVAAFCAVLMAGSVFTLERADRSAEFLACLPPTRMQHLLSKMTILFGPTVIMVCIHMVASMLSDMLLPHVRMTSHPFAGGSNLPSMLVITSILLSMIGGALAVSAWMNSNGVPILCGLMTPALSLSAVSLLGYLFDIPMQGEQFATRYAVASAVLGSFLTFCGAYWYVERIEP